MGNEGYIIHEEAPNMFVKMSCDRKNATEKEAIYISVAFFIAIQVFTIRDDNELFKCIIVMFFIW